MASSSPPKYPYPSEVKVTDFVRIKLSPTNYFTWRHQMFGFIGSKGLLDFINVDITAPPEMITVPDDDSSRTEEGRKEMKNKDYEDWERSDSLVLSWITDTINYELFPKNVVRQNTAVDMWSELEYQLLPSLGSRQVAFEAHKDLSRYLPLHKAAIKGDWVEAKSFFEPAEAEPADAALRAIITERWETALIVASRSVQTNHFVKNMVKLMTADDVALADISGMTALHVAAGADNIEAAKLLVEKNPDLPHFWDADNSLPLHRAALFGRRKMVNFLLTVTKEDAVQKPFEDESGAKLVNFLIESRLCGVPSKLETSANHGGGDVENPQQLLYSPSLVRQKLLAVLWRVAEILVPAQIKYIQGEKVVHHQALKLLKHLCMEVTKLDYVSASSIIGRPVTLAANNGIHEVVEEILETFPSAVYLTDSDYRNVFHLAIMNRCENVFKLIYQFEELRRISLATTDINGNNGLHFAGRSASRQSRTRLPGAALQMQRELQWFKEVERLSDSLDKEHKNKEGKTPEELFSETHEELVKDGERWMRETAYSCTIVATLIATVVFAAAITVPGGNNQHSGLPIFSKEIAFLIFGISDALALFSSTSSMLMFLSILTSRYAQEDFLHSLPNKLIYGMVSLFLSIIFMMIAFGATLYLVFGLKKAWILIPMAALGCLPVSLFASLQFPLLLDIIKSTHCSSIFYKKSDRFLS